MAKGLASLLQRAAESRRELGFELSQKPELAWVSPVLAIQQEQVVPLVKRYARGRFLDVGAGTAPFRGLIASQVSQYQTLDIEARTSGIDYIGDLQDLRGVIASEAFDTVMALEVLEHIPDSKAAVSELFRILAPGGVALISVPHLSRLHEEPHDYFRFTGYGLRHLFEGAGFEVLKLEPLGGLLSFLGHQVALTSLTLGWKRPLVHELMLNTNKWLISKPALYLDAKLTQAKFPLGYMVAARRPA